MTLRRLKLAEWTALAGAVGLLVTLFLDWFSVRLPPPTPSGWKGYAPADASTTGWSALGWFTILLVVICILAAIGLATALVLSGVDAYNTPPGVVLAAFGIPALVVLFLVTLSRPGLGLDLPNGAVHIEPAGWAGLIFAVLMVAGGMASLRDERTTGFGRHFTPPAPRPAPPTH